MLRSSDVVLLLARDGSVRYAADSCSSVLGLPSAALVGQTLDSLAHPDDAASVRGFLETVRQRQESRHTLVWRMKRGDSSIVFVETLATNLLDDRGVQGIVTNNRDVSERRMLQDELAFLAFHDGLTGLPNRALFLDRVEQAVAHSSARGARVSVLFIDLDNFKTVNDSLGHAAGDQVLIAAAGRLRRCLRTEDCAARLGGDEFGVLLEEEAAAAPPGTVAERIARAFEAPFVIDGHEVVATASVGLAIARAGDGGSVVLRNADTAMYAAKARGRSRWQLFESQMHDSAVAQLGMRGDLHHALERGELRVVYQPIVALVDGHARGAEALLRWTHPTRGELSPASFIPLAEQTGLIVSIGSWVLEQACIDAARWRDLDPERSPYVTVNLSVRQLQDPGLLEHVTAALECSELDPAALTLEITESCLMENRDGVLSTLEALRAKGIRIAIDDFGTGYSSLEYLERLPIDILKVPKNFVDRLADRRAEPILPRAILLIAQALDFEVVAEGIESAEQAQRLVELGCKYGQGYLFARPMDTDSFVDYCARQARPPRPVDIAPAWIASA